MHEVEKDTAEMDVIAAGLNSDAARIVSIAEERVRSATDRKRLAAYGGKLLNSEEPPPEEEMARLEREEGIAQQIAAEAEKARDAAAAIQQLVREMRGRLAAAGGN